MTPKERAKEIYDKHLNSITGLEGHEWWESSKQCALITINLMIVQNGELYLNSLGEKTIEYYKQINGYLFEVKSEIEKL